MKPLSFKGKILRCVTFTWVLLVLSSSTLSFARDLQGRFGLGFNREFENYRSLTSPTGVPAISLKYGLTRDIAVAGIIGVATTDPLNSVTALKFFKNVFYETSLNFYFMVGGGLVKVSSSSSGAQFLAGFGAEFFIPGIESLGFSVETGLTFDNLSGGFIVRTLGVSFLDAGIHFYF
jgi:hypothetical protein